MQAKAWKVGAAGEPGFPNNYEIKQKSVLQATDIKSNHNKYYALELHVGQGPAGALYRLFTHYGRTDDLETNPDSGQKENRYFATLQAALAGYQAIYAQKTSPRKGYQEVALASSKIGSEKARGTSSGDVDAKTLEKLNGHKSDGKQAKKPSPKTTKKSKKPALPTAVQELVRYIYDEATGALTSQVQAKITANGIETPLGVLTIGQIEKGEQILAAAYDVFQQPRLKNKQERLEQLSSQFYTVIPHRFGRSRAAAAAAVLDRLEQFEQKQNTLQLMKDMLQVNGEAGSVLFDAEVHQEYEALGCRIQHVPPDAGEYAQMCESIRESLVKRKRLQVVNLYRVAREAEHKAFRSELDNQQMLFHGSRIQNWVGLLSRGILLPKIVVSMGVHRTDAGWLGHGIYFGDAACTSMAYATPGRRKTSLMAVARVGLGQVKQYRKITYGLSAPPSGFDSCHGVRRQRGIDSEFDDDEFVIYDTRQQRLEYLVEFKA
jgi:poly [ADP-ribose] polymerase